MLKKALCSSFCCSVLTRVEFNPLRKGDGYNQTEMVENRVLKIEEIWLSTNQLIQVLDKKGRLSDLQKRQLRELNGYLVTLHAILKMSSSLEIDGNFIYSGDVASTKVFSIMMKKKTDRGLPSRLPYHQDHISSTRQGLSAAEYTHRDENRFINGAHIDKGAMVI